MFLRISIFFLRSPLFSLKTVDPETSILAPAFFALEQKTKTVRDLINKQNLNVDVEIDGGINFENCSKAKSAGANILVSGSTVFKENKGDLEKNIEILRNN